MFSKVCDVSKKLNARNDNICFSYFTLTCKVKADGLRSSSVVGEGAGVVAAAAAAGDVDVQLADDVPKLL